jgi:hypothetical protein
VIVNLNSEPWVAPIPDQLSIFQSLEGQGLIAILVTKPPDYDRNHGAPGGMRLSCEKSVHQENAVPIRITAIAPAIILVFGLAAGGAQAQVPGHTPMPKDHAAHHAGMAAQPSGAVPTMPGQDAFGTV